MLVYVVAFIFYAHLVPELRAIGTALLAGAGVVSIVAGLAAQNTLGNLVAGLSLVLYRPIQMGDTVQLSAHSGVVTARFERISLGFTVLRADSGAEVDRAEQRDDQYGARAVAEGRAGGAALNGRQGRR